MTCKDADRPTYWHAMTYAECRCLESITYRASYMVISRLENERTFHSFLVFVNCSVQGLSPCRGEPRHARLDPLLLLPCLAFRAMAIAAGVVRNPHRSAGVAGIDMAAQRCRSAGNQPSQDGPLLRRDRMACAIGGGVHAKDVGHLQRAAGSGHLCAPRFSVTWGERSCFASSSAALP